ncbi:MAG: D-aminoacyl-tRNA deacylase [Candidatus Heimdallarchaeota archaeon]|nr:D-aminoacyl-tRNA deacylase [Candidatus Heimdallarchaeota archaeon]
MKIKASIIIIISEQDIAGQNMKKYLIEKLLPVSNQLIPTEIYYNEQLHKLYPAGSICILEIPNSQIQLDYLRDNLESDVLIFASKHSSQTGKKTLLVHTTGLWGKNTGHGGNDHELAFAPAKLLRWGYDIIKKLTQERNLHEYWYGIECTHHGPTSFPIPIIFVETGGSEEEWMDLEACKLIADVIIALCDKFRDNNQNPAFIGVGGGHYCPRFIDIINKTDYLIGHIIPKYAHEYLNEKMLIQAVEKTIANEKFVLIDKKGTKSDVRKQVIAICEKNNFKWELC